MRLLKFVRWFTCLITKPCYAIVIDGRPRRPVRNPIERLIIALKAAWGLSGLNLGPQATVVSSHSIDLPDD